MRDVTRFLHANPHRESASAERPYSAAWRTWRAVGVRIVTSSSDAVGCSAMVASKSALVAFIFTAIATPAADVISMFLLAIPMIALYFVAVGIAVWHDRIADRRQAQAVPA